jgi:chloride channel protein, CIC family
VREVPIKNGLVSLRKEFNFLLAGKWLILGVAVGVVGGLGAIVFQFLLQLMREFFLTGFAGLDLGSPGGEPPAFTFAPGNYVPYLVVGLPALGGLVAGILVYRLAPEAEGHGTDAAIDAYHRKLGRIRARVPLVKMLASAITLGTGGSGGREGPIAQIGAGFGSFLGTRLGLGTNERRWLLAAGIGAGVGSIFRAPLAGAIFAGEVLYSSTDVETEVLLPATVSSIVAYAVYATRFGWDHMFSDAGAYGFSNPLELLPYLVLALVVSLAALGYIKAFYGTRDLFARLPIPKEVRPMVGGALTGIVALVLITAFGTTRDVGDVLSSGYGIIQHVISSDGKDVAIAVLLVVGVGKILTTSLSIGSGGSGGVFGPSMVIGATLGAAVGKGFHYLAPNVVQHPTTFAIVGMAGFFAAAANTPISTVVMVSELTGNYELLVPSMWVCTLAFLFGKRWSIYRSQLPSKVWSPAHFGEYAPEVFDTTRVEEVFKRTRKLVSVPHDMPLPEVLRVTDQSRQRLFPVLDTDGKLLGAFRVDEITHALHERSQRPEQVTAGSLLHGHTFAVRLSDRVEHAQGLLRLNNLEELLVVDDDDPSKVMGILTSADILLAYTRRLSRKHVDGEEGQFHGKR